MSRYQVQKTGSLFWSRLLIGMAYGLLCFGLLIGGVVASLYVKEKFAVGILAILVVAVAVVIVFLLRRLSYFNCPQCKTRIHVDDLTSGKKVEFSCDACKVTWQTNFNASNRFHDRHQ